MKKFIVTILVACASGITTAYPPSSPWNYNGYTNTAEVFSNPGTNPSGRLFWDKLNSNTNWSGSNQVGGSWIQQLANKFPFFNSRMQYPYNHNYNGLTPNVYYQNDYPNNVYSAQFPSYNQPGYYPPNQPGYYPPGSTVVGDTVSVSAPGFQGYSYQRPQVRFQEGRQVEDLAK